MLINQADNQFESENWEKALISYESAKSIFDRDYPNSQITKINTKLTELRDQQGKDAQNRAAYDNIIKEADQLFLEESIKSQKINLTKHYPYLTMNIIQKRKSLR